ncbi:D-alanyl-D-alanine carboxypeptidase/D-alanyl-D-alanine-endopeptidase [Streptomyces tubercidicus]|uniref:D-alanyl-D-alanine carboxypeptidase/D-alanyl-D-alanine endopeptidase n=1 Tax=Streptomyces tubercidicus TaxID=47759 RepID=UPI002E11D672|nr:D-alanyl-D-alanine carboxypeptidase/D-alanyl-D-alanine-endopeptidase [Streptomyces tubercidicus]WSX19999.1 D-alanyl-D-alanine carboxypeptidase/D-alanyl-D-alanine-endopeptidase [Streptomyces tubercidicus]
MNEITTARAPAETFGGRRRHRRPKPMTAATRRALVLVTAAPVAGVMLAGPSAYAAENPGTATPPVPAPDSDSSAQPAAASSEQKLIDNLNTRINDPRLGNTFSGVVLDSASDKVIWGHNASTALMPASNAKLATATAALTVLGPEHRFTTKVVYGNGTLTLIGGGDRTLTTDDLAELAKTAVAGLKSAGVDNVKVRVDDSLFPEPALAHGWNDGYYPDTVAPVRALAVDGRHVTDTSLDAGKVFAQHLAADGITVDGEATRGRAERTDVPVARHKSPRLADIVHRMLKSSDNNIAETLLRMTALGAGRPATFDDGTAVVRHELRKYGVPLDNVQLHDGSGLSRASRIPAATLAALLDLPTDPRYARTLGAVLDGLPVAGEAGATLSTETGRFDDPDSRCAVGKVRAKTGTLTGAVALSGLTKGDDGKWKIFSFVENNSTAQMSATKDALDGLAATVNGCRA